MPPVSRHTEFPALPLTKHRRASVETLTKTQWSFIHHYIANGGNGAKAARDAGYKRPDEATRLLQHRVIRDQIDKRRRELETQFDITAARVIEEMAGIAFADVADYVRIGSDKTPELVPLANLTRAQRAAIREIRVNSDGSCVVKLNDKHAALKDLGTHLRLFDTSRPTEQEPKARGEDLRAELLQTLEGMRARMDDGAPAAPMIDVTPTATE